jgi:protein subunit release factor B
MPDSQQHGPRIVLPADDSALLRQCEVSVFRASGPGGQHVNTTDSAVRLRHRPSGIMVTDQSTRSQQRNRLNCLQKLRHEVKRRNYRKPNRKKTKMSRSAKRRMLDSKKKHGQKKRLRGKRGIEH